MQSFGWKILWVLCATLGTLFFINTRSAQACSLVVHSEGYEIYAAEDVSLTDVPVDGGWGFPTHRGVRFAEGKDVEPPPLVVDVRDEEDNRIPGRVEVLVYGDSWVTFNVRREPVFISWIPDTALRPNHTYDVYLFENETRWEEALEDEHAWKNYGVHTTFKTVDEKTEQGAHGAEVKNVAGEYVDRPAYNRRCEQKKPCTSSCGCETYFWSTRYDWIPTLEVDLTLPAELPPLQSYATIENDDGDVIDVIWEEGATARRTYELTANAEPPFCLTVKTFLLVDDTPLATEKYCATEDDFEPRGETTLRAERAPKQCRKSTIESVDRGEHAMPSSGCQAAPNTAPPASLWAWVLLLVGGLRLRRRERVG